MRRSQLALATVCTGWGTIPLIVRHVDLPAVAIVAVRVWVAAAGLGLVVALRRGRGPALLSVERWRIAAVGVVLAAHWVALFSAYKRVPAGTVVLIVYLAPVGIAALAPRVLGERVGPRILAGLGLAVAGVVLVAWPAVHRHGRWTLGVGLAVVAAVLFVALVLLSAPVAEAYGGLRCAFLELAGAGILLVPLAARVGWGHPQASWAWLVVLGLAHTAIGTGVYLASLPRIGATQTGILGYLEPASVVACSWAFLGERPGVDTLAGGVLIVVAGALVITSPVAGRVSRPALEVPAGAVG